MLSVAVVVRTRLSPACPHLLFRGATSPGLPAGPGVGKFLWAASAAQRRLTHLSGGYYTTRTGGIQIWRVCRMKKDEGSIPLGRSPRAWAVAERRFLDGLDNSAKHVANYRTEQN